MDVNKTKSKYNLDRIIQNTYFNHQQQIDTIIFLILRDINIYRKTLHFISMVLFFHNMLQIVLLVVIPNPINLLQIYSNKKN